MHDPKANRLSDEYQKLLRLCRRSDFIKVEPVDMRPAYPPEKYIITYTCKGIERIDKNEEPVPLELHRVEMQLIDFPIREPLLRWMTPIWHPNIEHSGLRKVCTDNPKSWFASKSLDLLVINMGRMVQYQLYHAEWTPPYPIDKDAANWVLNYAEPRKIIGPDKPFDSRQLLRPLSIGLGGSQQSGVSNILADIEEDRQIVFGRPEKNQRTIFGKPFYKR